MHPAVMSGAQQHAIIHCGVAVVMPLSNVVGVAQGGGPVAPRKTAPTIARNERSANTERHRALGTPDIQWLTVAAHHHGDDLAVAGGEPGLGGGESLAVVQGGPRQLFDQGLVIHGDRDMRRFPARGGHLVVPASQVAQLDQCVGVALGWGARIGDVLGQRAGCGELLDQPPKRRAVQRVEPALQTDPAVAAIPDMQLTGGGAGILRLSRR